MLCLGDLPDLLIVLVLVHAAAEILLAHVGSIDDRLGGQQGHVMDPAQLVLGKVEATGRLALFQMRLQTLQKIHLRLKLLIALQRLFGAVNAACHHLHVREDQFQIDGFDVRRRIDSAVHVDDVVILEAANHMHNGIHLTNVAEELVSQSLALGSALDQTGNVHKFQRCRRKLVRLVHLRQLVQTAVRHGDNAHVLFNGAERVVGRFCAGIGQRIEQGAFSHVGESHHT